MLIDVELNYPENEISDLTTNSFKHFYDGSEIVVAGRFVDSNQNHLSVDVRGEGVSMDFFDFFKIHKNTECFFYLHCDEQKCHVIVENWVMFSKCTPLKFPGAMGQNSSCNTGNFLV